MLLSLPDELIRHICSPQLSKLHDFRSLRFVCKRVFAIVMQDRDVHNRVAAVEFLRHPLRDIVCESAANLEDGRIRALLIHDVYERLLVRKDDIDVYHNHTEDTRTLVTFQKLRPFTQLEYLSISYSTPGGLPDERHGWLRGLRGFFSVEDEIKANILSKYALNETVSLFVYLTHLEIIGYRVSAEDLAQIPEGQLVELNLCVPVGERSYCFYSESNAFDLITVLERRKHKLRSLTLSLEDLTFLTLYALRGIADSLESLSFVWMEDALLPSRSVSARDCGKERLITRLAELLRSLPKIKHISLPLCPGTLLSAPFVSGDRKFAVGELEEMNVTSGITDSGLLLCGQTPAVAVRNKIKVVESDVRRNCDKIAEYATKLQLVGWLVPIKNYDGYQMLWCKKIPVEGEAGKTSWKIGFEADFGGDPWPASDMDSVF